jgi:hypothetical protein
VLDLTSDIDYDIDPDYQRLLEPESGTTPVGGVATTTNKLEILTPYLALAGLIITVSAVYVVKRRKD